LWQNENGSKKWKDWIHVRGRRDNLDTTMVLLIWTLNQGHCCCCCRARNLWENPGASRLHTISEPLSLQSPEPLGKIPEPPDCMQIQSCDVWFNFQLNFTTMYLNLRHRKTSSKESILDLAPRTWESEMNY
jgi:hypothetical protein